MKSQWDQFSDNGIMTKAPGFMYHPDMELIFKRIDEESIDTVMNLLKEAAVWLQNKNIDYWQEWHNPQEGPENWILEGVKKNQFYLVYDSARLIGMFRLQYEDEMFWGKQQERAGYIHSFTIKRELAGKGIGYKVLLKIEHNLKNEGIGYFRLDCGVDIKKLSDYYINYGFKPVGEVTVHGFKALLLEKRINI